MICYPTVNNEHSVTDDCSDSHKTILQRQIHLPWEFYLNFDYHSSAAHSHRKLEVFYLHLPEKSQTGWLD